LEQINFVASILNLPLFGLWFGLSNPKPFWSAIIFHRAFFFVHKQLGEQLPANGSLDI